MKKLKCLSCGGDLKLDESKEYGICEYCHTKYKLNEDLNVNIKLDDNINNLFTEVFDRVAHPFKKAKFVFLPVIIFAIIITLIAFITFRTTSSKMSNNRNSDTEIQNTAFNLPFAHLNGTQPKIFVEGVLDSIVQSNKTNKRTITLVYEDNKTTDEKEIVNIKHSLENKNYEVTYDYDKDGYINVITIELLN